MPMPEEQLTSRKRILAQLLLLSKMQFRHATEERWSEWEVLEPKRRELCQRLAQMENWLLDREEIELVAQIQATGKVIVEAIHRAQKKTGEQIRRLRMVRGALKKYWQANTNPLVRHFKIQC